MGLLGGRFPILIILVLGLVVAATKGVPWVLKQFRDPTPVFRVDDVRNIRYVDPYGIPSDWDGESALGTVRVHGPSVTQRYSVRGANPRYETLPPADGVIEVAANETVIFPDGERLRLEAIALVPTWTTLGPVDGDKREEEVLDPNGMPLSQEEIDSLIMRTGFDKSEPVNGLRHMLAFN